MASDAGSTAIWDQIRTAVLAAAGAGHVKVGVLTSGHGNDEHDGITLVELAAIHEFGSPAAGIPQRSFVRSTFQVRKIDALAALQTKLAEKIVRNAMPVHQALGILGAWGAAQVKQTIRQRATTGPEPQELKPETIERKGSSLPLVDTGRLLDAITWEVVE